MNAMNMNTTDKPWTMSVARYQHLRGIRKRATVISRRRLSVQGLCEYYKKVLEWNAAWHCEQDWADEVMAAFDSGEFALDDPDVHEDAADRVRGELRRREEIAKKKAEAMAQDAARIKSTEELCVGQQVWLERTRTP